MIRRIIDFILDLFGLRQKSQESYNTANMIRVSPYYQKNFMTGCELDFYDKIKELEVDYKIVPQINLATIIQKRNKGYINELFKNIDFAIFTNDYRQLLLLIELNDKSHNKKNRKNRDLKVKKICNEVDIKLITFYTQYPNTKDYVINRIKSEINNITGSNIQNNVSSYDDTI